MYISVKLIGSVICVNVFAQVARIRNNAVVWVVVGGCEGVFYI